MAGQSAGSITEQLDLFLRSFRSSDGSIKYISRIDRMIADGGSSVIIDYEDLLSFDAELATVLIENPDSILRYFRDAAIQVVRTENLSYAERVEDQLQVRISGLIDRLPLRGVSAKYLDRLVSISGMVVRTSEVKPRAVVAAFRDPQDHVTLVAQTGNLLRKPEKCAACDETRNFELDTRLSKFTDYQIIRLQELPEELPPGQLPQSIDAELLGDIVNRARPGDRIIITGIVRADPESSIGAGKQTVFRTRLETNHVDVRGKEMEQITITPEDEAAIKKIAESPTAYEDLVRSVCPTIFGFETQKEAALLVLVGAPQSALPDQTTIRGDLNLLLVGDPGCLVYDERVVLSDGAIVKIGELGNEHLQKIDVKLLSDASGRSDDATTFHVYKGQKVMEVITETGKSIKGTYNHPLLTVAYVNGLKRYEWRRLDELRIGDRVVTVSRLPCRIKNYIPSSFVQYFDNESIRLPDTVTPLLGSFLGYMTGKGYVNEHNFTFGVISTDTKYDDGFVSLTRKIFGLEPVRHGRIIEFSSKNVSANIRFLIQKRVPELILRSGNKVVSSYLLWLYRAAGRISGNSDHKAILLHSENTELLRDVHLLLLRFGIRSKISGCELMITDLASAKKFSRNIGLLSKRELKGFCEESFLPDSERIEKVIKDVEYADVYDVEVPATHMFIANGIISHNTAKSELLKYIARLAPRGLYTTGRGSTAAGLCVSGDTLLVTSNGIKAIKDVVEEQLHGKELRKTDGITVCDNPGTVGLVIPSLAEQFRYLELDRSLVALKTLSLESFKAGKATQFYRIKAQKVIRIKTELGKSLALTAETQIMCYDISNGICFWKRADEIRAGDHLIFSTKLPELASNMFKPVEFIDDSDFIVMQKSKIEQLLASVKISSEESESANCIQGYRQYSRRKDLLLVRLKDIKLACKRFGLNLEEMLGSKILVVSCIGNRKQVEWSIPTEADGIMEFLGYFYSRGSLSLDKKKGEFVTFSSRKYADCRKFAKEAARLFNVKAIIKQNAGHFTAVLHSRTIALILAHYGLSQEYDSSFINNAITAAPNRLLSAFLRGFFSGSKCIFGRGFISLTINGEAARQVDLLLQRFGIISSLHERNCKNKDKPGRTEEPYEIRISDRESLNLFASSIGFSAKKRNTALQRSISRKNDSESHTSFVRAGESSIALPVLEINAEQADTVYDITVEESHSFLANGFVVHNTAAVVKEKNGLMMLEAGAVVLADLGVACLLPETPIVYNDKIVKIEDIAKYASFEPAISKGEKVEVGLATGLVYSFDADDKFTKETIATVIRRKWYNGEIISFKLKTGDILRVTPDHMLLEGSKIAWRQASEFKVGESIISPLTLPATEQKTWIWDLLPDDFLVNLTEDGKINLATVLGRPPETIQSSILLKELKTLIRQAGMEEIWRQRINTYCRTGLIEPFLTPEVSYEVGYQGSIQDPNHQSADNSLRSKTVKSIADKMFSNSMSYLLSLNTDNLSSFFAGLMDASGFDPDSSILYRSKDKMSCTNIALVSRRLGILATVEDGDENVVKIDTIIDHSLFGKVEGKLRRLKIFHGDRYSALFVNEASSSQQNASLTALEGYFLNSIVSISKEKYEGYVYDLHVPQFHNYIASGVVVENCIDEFDKMRPEDRGVLHEVMEQQSYHPSTEIELASGRRVRIGEYVENIFASMKGEVIHGLNCEIIPLKSGEAIYSYDFESMHPRLTRISRVSRHFAPDTFVKIEFSNGRSIIVTPEHPIFIYQNERIEIVRADEVREFSLIPALLQLNVEGSYTYAMESLERITIVRKEIVQNKGIYATDWVYDVTVEPFHNFIADGIILHNTVSVAKGGIVATLNARTSIVAAANPLLGRYDPYKNIYENVNLPIPLLSVGPDEEIVVRKDGKTMLLPIAKLVDGFYNGKDEGFPVSVRGLQIACMDENLNVVWGDLAYVFRHKAEGRHFRVFYGKKDLILTAGHCVYTVHEGRIILKQTSQLKVGDLLLVSDKSFEADSMENVAEGNNQIALMTQKISGLHYEPIKKIEELGEDENPEFVYDLSVPGLENFLADGVVCHNTRFDTIFIVRDNPDRAIDEKLATHILETHRSRQFVSPPPIDFELLRKYIVYAKKIEPVLTPEAEKRLLEFYLEMRSLGAQENMITVTPRQLETLIRLSTARARVLLRDKVTEEDAQQAILLMRKMLSTVGIDVKTGKIDIGVIQGRPASERTLIDLALEVFKGLQGPERTPVHVKTFVDALEKTGKFNREEARKMINTLYKLGQIYEIKTDYYSRIA
ncbi:MAG: LAGLIDADG family homing endonuclease [Conexivisphaerales archaeon]